MWLKFLPGEAHGAPPPPPEVPKTNLRLEDSIWKFYSACSQSEWVRRSLTGLLALSLVMQTSRLLFGPCDMRLRWRQ